MFSAGIDNDSVIVFRYPMWYRGMWESDIEIDTKVNIELNFEVGIGREKLDSYTLKFTKVKWFFIKYKLF